MYLDSMRLYIYIFPNPLWQRKLLQQFGRPTLGAVSFPFCFDNCMYIRECMYNKYHSEKLQKPQLALQNIKLLHCKSFHMLQEVEMRI